MSITSERESLTAGITSVARTMSRNHVLSGTSVSSSSSVRSFHSSASNHGRELLPGRMVERPTEPVAVEEAVGRDAAGALSWMPAPRGGEELPLSVSGMAEESAHGLKRD